MKSIKDYVALITKNYRDAKENNVSRFSIAWGQWSAPMNVEIRKRIENNDPQTYYLKYVFQLWVVLSKLLELEQKNVIKRWVRAHPLNDELTMVVAILAEGMKNERSEYSTEEHLRGSGVHSGAAGESPRFP